MKEGSIAKPCCSHKLLAERKEAPLVVADASSSALSADQPAACCWAVSLSVLSTCAIWLLVAPRAPSSNIERALARLKGDITMFDIGDAFRESLFNSDNENCCSD